MIYLICPITKENELAEIGKPKALESDFWKYALEITNHKNVIYSLDFYKKAIKQILPNRVNVIFTKENRKKIPPIMNGIIESRITQILNSYKNKVDDVYIYADKYLIDIFYRYADFVVVYQTEQLTTTYQSVFECINFAYFDLLKKEIIKGNKIEYYVQVKNTIGI